MQNGGTAVTVNGCRKVRVYPEKGSNWLGVASSKGKKCQGQVNTAY